MTDSQKLGLDQKIPVVRLRDALVQASVTWLLARLVVSCIGAITLMVRNGPSWTDRAGARVPDGVGEGFFALLHHWDSGYFLAIATGGYFHQDAAAGLPGFFPGYPLLARLLAGAFSAGDPSAAQIVAAMWTVSLASSWAASILVWRIAAAGHGAGVARVATVLFVAGPYSVFLAANYSESLFLVFAGASWYAASRRRWLWAGIWCGLAGFTRINGLFLMVALVTWYVVASRREGRTAMNTSALAIVPAVAGTAAYFGYLWSRTGDVFAWGVAQRAGWGRELHWPWEALYQTAGRAVLASTLDRRLQFGLDIVVAVLLVAGIVVWVRRREWPAAVLAGTTLLALTTSFTFVSLARNSLTVFPAVILLADLLCRQRRRWLRRGVLTVWFGLFLLNTALFAAGYWTD